MYEQDNLLKTAELSTEQNYNMIDGLLNNGPPHRTFPRPPYLCTTAPPFNLVILRRSQSIRTPVFGSPEGALSTSVPPHKERPSGLAGPARKGVSSYFRFLSRR